MISGSTGLLPNSPMYIAGMPTSCRAQNIGFIKSSLGEPISKRNALADDHLSTILTPKSYQFVESCRFPQCGQLLTQ
jgi:hypothetical protein